MASQLQKNFLQIAVNDLVASRYLLEKKLFPQAVFYQQQAVEKINKYFALDYPFMEPIDLNKIGHNTNKVYTKVLEDQINHLLGISTSLNPIAAIREKEGKDNSIYLNNLKDSLNNLRHIKNYNLEDPSVELILTALNLLKDTFENPEIPEDIEGLSKLKFEELIEFLESMNIIEKGSTETMRRALEIDYIKKDITKKYKDFIRVLPEYISALFIAFLLSLVFTFHAVKTRYPDYKDDFNPIEYYNEENPLVKYLKTFHDFTELAIIRINKFIEIMG